MKKIYMIGHTHFDAVWLWRWDESLSALTATFRSALDRMDEYEDFTYSFSAPTFFEWIKNSDEELFERIKKRIEEGRWELGEAWWLQADCNGANGESYIRQGLYAQNYFMENFNKRSKTVFNIDSFGHPATLPQILEGCGIENYVFWRPHEDDVHFESDLFVWKGENGSSVKAYRGGNEGGEGYPTILDEENFKSILELADTIPNHEMLAYGVTDHGGAPTKRMIELILQQQKEKRDLMDIRFGRIGDFFEEVDMNSVPELKGEFLVQFTGPYANFTEIKKNNRKSEYSVMNAEKVSVIAEKLLQREYPTDIINSCWKDIMFNQFHDILGGACIKDAYFDQRNVHGRAMQNADEIVHFGLQAITNKIKMPGKNPDSVWNLVVWNLNGFPAETEIEAEVQWAPEFPWYDGGIELIDEQGNIIPCQLIHTLPVVPRFRSRFVFKAKLPSLGYRSYIVKQTHEEVERTVEQDNTGILESESYELKYGADGIEFIRDKVHNKILTGTVFKPYVREDDGDTWGFNKSLYEEEKQFLTLATVEIYECGSIRKTLKLAWEYNKSTVVQYISIYKDHIDCKYRILWNEEKATLKFMFSAGKKMMSEISCPYGCVKREQSASEKPMGEWVKMYNEEEKIVVISDSIFSYDFDGENIGTTMVRNCIYGDMWHDVDYFKDRDFDYMGQGASEGRIRLIFDGNESAESMLFNNQPIILCEANHDGILEPAKSFYQCSDDNILLTTLKKAEHEEQYVIRTWNAADEKVTSEIKLFDYSAEVENGLFEIKSLMTRDDTFKEVNMLEEDK